ncbi:MAG: hypothetical protein ACI8QC_000074 [Planctomycetota bacterium]
MGVLNLIAGLSCLGLAFASPQDPLTWEQRWAQLDQLSVSENADLRDSLVGTLEQLQSALHAESSKLEVFRVGMLAHSLQLPAEDWSASALPRGLDTDELGRAAAALDSGLARAQALAQLLVLPGLDARQMYEYQTLGYAAFLEDHDRFAALPARLIAEAMHSTAQATWSAFCVEGISRRYGDHDRAIAVIDERLLAVAQAGTIQEQAELLERRAISAMGANRKPLAEASLGRALRLGGQDALQILGKIALDAGRREEACRLFSALLARSQARGDEAAPWALRGWGVSLLPPGPK